MQVFKHPVTINLWLGNRSCTLFDYDLNGIREQLLTLLRQLESVNPFEFADYEVTVTCKMSGVTTIYNGDNRNEVVNTIRQILNAYGMSPEHPSFNKLPRYNVDVGNDAVANQHTVDKNGSITRTDSYVSKINLSEEDQINIARKLLKDCGLIQ